MTSKNEQNLKQLCHPYQKIQQVEIPFKSYIYKNW